MPEIAARRDDASAAFFDATAQRRLPLLHCARCDYWVAPYQRFGSSSRHCPQCSSLLEHVDGDGRATVVTWTVVHQRAAPGGEPSAHTVGIVELVEGPWLIAPLLDVEADALDVGDPLVIDFVAPGDGEWIPAFRPAG